MHLVVDQLEDNTGDMQGNSYHHYFLLQVLNFIVYQRSGIVDYHDEKENATHFKSDYQLKEYMAGKGWSVHSHPAVGLWNCSAQLVMVGYLFSELEFSFSFIFIFTLHCDIMEASHIIHNEDATKAVDEYLAPISWVFPVTSEREVRK